jgi:hypothetical protein
MLKERHPDDDAAVLLLAGHVPLACRAVPGLLAALAGDPRNDGAPWWTPTDACRVVVAIYRRAPLRAALERLPDRIHG